MCLRSNIWRSSCRSRQVSPTKTTNTGVRLALWISSQHKLHRESTCVTVEQEGGGDNQFAPTLISTSLLLLLPRDYHRRDSRQDARPSTCQNIATSHLSGWRFCAGSDGPQDSRDLSVKPNVTSSASFFFVFLFWVGVLCHVVCSRAHNQDDPRCLCIPGLSLSLSLSLRDAFPRSHTPLGSLADDPELSSCSCALPSAPGQALDEPDRSLSFKQIVPEHEKSSTNTARHTFFLV